MESNALEKSTNDSIFSFDDDSMNSQNLKSCRAIASKTVLIFT